MVWYGRCQEVFVVQHVCNNDASFLGEKVFQSRMCAVTHQSNSTLWYIYMCITGSREYGMECYQQTQTTFPGRWRQSFGNRVWYGTLQLLDGRPILSWHTKVFSDTLCLGVFPPRMAFLFGLPQQS